MWVACFGVEEAGARMPPRRGARARMRSNPHRTARCRRSRPASRARAIRPARAPSAGSSQGQNGVRSSRTATRSASSPRRERAAVGEPERARAVERRQLQRRGRRERLGVARARARQQQRGAQLVEHVERERGRRAVGAEAHAHAGGAQLGERRDAAAEQRVRARAVRHGGAASRASAAISSSPDVHRVGDDRLGPEQPALGELEDRVAPEGRDEARRARRCRRPARRARGATRRGA